MKAYIFPGQGSQFVGMGYGLFEKYPEIIGICDRVLEYSITDLCLYDRNKKLGLTQYTQPALYTVNALYYYEKMKDYNKPDYVAGHSLGEYNALLAAGVIDFETGLRLVKQRGCLMGNTKGGGMAAVLNLQEDKINEILIRHNFDNKIFIANYNSPGQIVIAGDKESIESAKPYFEEAGARAYVVLNVSGAFHSPMMNNANIEYKKYIDKFEMEEPLITVIANLTAKPYVASELIDTLSNQMTNPVRWTDTLIYLLSHNVDDIEQVGPGEVLTGLVGQTKRAAAKGEIVLVY